ncbi:MAG TPA: tRNA (adenosine(37)-N6)-dimethylallyltransferase MiaA [Acidimicrobiales bacterium]
MTAPHLVLVGPTASGKSAVALEIARRHPRVELVSVDSMQVYRGMDVGTAKPSAADRAAVRHHVVDLVEPTEDYSVARFQRAVYDALSDIERRGSVAVLVGGTGLYVRAIVDDLEIPGQFEAARHGIEAEPDTPALHARLAALDPVAAARMEPTNRRRVVRALEVTVGSGRPFSSYGPGLDAYPPLDRFHLAGIAVSRDVLTARIAARFEAMLDCGLLDEVRELARRHDGRLSRTARQALGYRELLRHVEDGAPLDDVVAEAIQRTRTFAVRQERWFRRDPRIHWYDGDDGNAVALADRVLGDWSPA